MTRGTVVLFGTVNRELELFCSRLEREHFTVIHCANLRSFQSVIRSESVQCLLSAETNGKTLRPLIGLLKKAPRRRSVPVILLTEDTIPRIYAHNTDIGEVFRLHRITLADAVRRLRLAIQLSHLPQA